MVARLPAVQGHPHFRIRNVITSASPVHAGSGAPRLRGWMWTSLGLSLPVVPEGRQQHSGQRTALDRQLQARALAELLWNWNLQGRSLGAVGPWPHARQQRVHENGSKGRASVQCPLWNWRLETLYPQ